MHIALLDASLGTPHAQRNFTREFENTFGDTVSVFNVNDGQLPPPVAPPASKTSDADDVDPLFPFDAVVISGSQSSVYEPLDWIAPLEDWIAGVLAAKVPTLGVCWGHQILAQILGGTVEGGSYELGYVRVAKTDAGRTSPLLDGLADPFTAFATHSDYVVDLPDGATVLARNDASIQSFTVGSAVTTQFHPEYDLRTAEAMIRSKDIDAQTVQDALDTCSSDNVQAAESTKRLFRNFRALAQT